MKHARPTVPNDRDYTGLFVGMILAGLVAIVFVLVVAVGQPRARDLPTWPTPVAAKIQY